MHRLIFSLPLVLSMAVLAKAQDTSPVYENLKDVEWMVGNWVGTTKIPEGTVASDKLGELEGKKVTVHWKVSWAPGKSALIEEFEHAVEGAETIRGVAVTGWDQHSSSIRSHEHTTHKGVWSGTWTKEGDNWTYEYEGYNLDGNKGTGKRIMQLTSNHRLKVKETNQTMDGKPQPDMEWVFERTTISNNYEHLKPLEAVVGTWKFGGESEDGAKFEGHETILWAFNKNGLKGKGWYQPEGDVKHEYEYFVNWNALTKQTEMHFFAADGGATTRYGYIDPENRTWKSWQVGTQSDGTPLSGLIEIEYRDDKKSFEWKAIDGSANGVPWPALTITFTRLE